MPGLQELEREFRAARRDRHFWQSLRDLLHHYAGRPTPLYAAARLSQLWRLRLYLKREDLLHTGAHKINNTIGQALLARRMGKKEVVAETGAGQHGLAVATAGNLLGLQTIVYMGTRDMRRQALNVQRMRLLGAEVRPVRHGQGILKDAVNEAIRHWITRLDTSYYLVGSSVGPHPYPWIVREFQRIIGREARRQVRQREGRLPETMVAAGSGGSNAMGLFYEFLDDPVTLYFVEGGGKGLDEQDHAAVATTGEVGVLHGARMYLLQDADGQVNPSYTRAAGLNYPGRGPEISHLIQLGRVKAAYATDREALAACRLALKAEGLLPALETAHALAFLAKHHGRLPRESLVLLNFSGRGEKDLDTLIRHAPA